MGLNLLECLANATSHDEASARENLKDYNWEELAEECKRFEIAVAGDMRKDAMIDALILEAKKVYGPKYDYETAYFKPLDITLIVDHQLNEDHPLRLVNYYYGKPNEKYTADYIKLANDSHGLHEKVRIGGDTYDVVYTQSLNVTVVSLDQHVEPAALTYVGSYRGRINSEFTALTVQDFLAKESAVLSHMSGRLMVAIARKEHQQDIVVKYLDSDTATALVKVCNLQNIGMPQLLESFTESDDQYVLGYAEADDSDDVYQLTETMREHSNI